VDKAWWPYLCHIFRCTVPERMSRVWMSLMRSLCLNSLTLKLHPVTDSGSTRPALSSASVSITSTLLFLILLWLLVLKQTSSLLNVSERHCIRLQNKWHLQKTFIFLSILLGLLTNWCQGDWFYKAYAFSNLHEGWRQFPQVHTTGVTFGVVHHQTFKSSLSWTLYLFL